MPKDPRQAILDELSEIAGRLADVPDLYARRLELFKLGRAMEPKILVRELAEAAGGLTETAVTKELKRDVARAAG